MSGCRRRREYDDLDQLSRPIEESTVSSDKLTIGREGLVFSRREDSGYALQIPEGSFQNEVDVTITVHLPDSTPHSVPEGSELVSGVCHIVSREIELKKDGSLVIDHCANIGSAQDRDSVCVVRYNGRSWIDIISGSRRFHYVDDNDINVKSDCVGVTLRKLEPAYYAVTVAKERRGAVEYCGLLYYEPTTFFPLKFVFMVVKDLNIYVKVCISVASYPDCMGGGNPTWPHPCTCLPVRHGLDTRLVYQYLHYKFHATDIVHVCLHRQWKMIVKQSHYVRHMSHFLSHLHRFQKVKR